MAIHVHYQNVRFQIKDSAGIKRWLTSAVSEECKIVGSIDFFFIDDDNQRIINSEFLEHHYNTDVITFDYSENRKVSGEIYIAIDTVRNNSALLKTGFRREYLRVMLHGVLHLIGYKDKSEEEIRKMREREEYYLGKYGS